MKMADGGVFDADIAKEAFGIGVGICFGLFESEFFGSDGTPINAEGWQGEREKREEGKENFRMHRPAMVS